MQQSEVVKLVAVCSVNYRNWPDPNNLEKLVALWAKMLAEYDYFIVAAAVEKYLAESPYPPTIADIMKRITDITIAKEKTAIEAWGDVGQAIRRYGSYNETLALDMLTALTRKVVKSMGYRELCLSENEMADRAHFLKVYDTLAAREREDALMLPSTKEAIRHIQSGTSPLMRIK